MRGSVIARIVLAALLPVALPVEVVAQQLSNEARARNLRAVGYSILLPGLAQYRAGEHARGLAFMAAEAAFWTGFVSYRVQGNLRRDSYLEMARLYAGVRRPKGQSEDYYRQLASWSSSDVYNELVRWDARDVAGDDLEAREAYYQSHRISDDLAWRWESMAARVRFRDKRNDSRQSFRTSRNMVGLAVANRVVAILDAVLHGDEIGSTRLELRPGDGPELARARLCLTRDLK